MRPSRKSFEVPMVFCAAIAVTAAVSALFSFLEFLYGFFHPVIAPMRWQRLEQLCLGSVFTMFFAIWLYRKMAAGRAVWQSEIAASEPSVEGQAAGVMTARALWVHESICWIVAASLLVWLWYVWSRGAPYEWPSLVWALWLLLLPVLAGFFIWRVFRIQDWQRNSGVQERTD